MYHPIVAVRSGDRNRNEKNRLWNRNDPLKTLEPEPNLNLFEILLKPESRSKIATKGFYLVFWVSIHNSI